MVVAARRERSPTSRRGRRTKSRRASSSTCAVEPQAFPASKSSKPRFPSRCRETIRVISVSAADHVHRGEMRSPRLRRLCSIGLLLKQVQLQCTSGRRSRSHPSMRSRRAIALRLAVLVAVSARRVERLRFRGSSERAMWFPFRGGVVPCTVFAWLISGRAGDRLALVGGDQGVVILPIIG